VNTKRYNNPVVSKKLKIKNLKGLHARPSAKLVKAANKFDADIYVTKGEQTVNGKSIMSIMQLAAAKDEEITVKAVGPDADEAVKSISYLVKSKFFEE
tara:strand:- start:508 stop:801 length:294 start_codon:yes stop_codon:yes gene_type:complete